VYRGGGTSNDHIANQLNRAELHGNLPPVAPMGRVVPPPPGYPPAYPPPPYYPPPWGYPAPWFYPRPY
jgi:hypothetical protein